MQIVKKIFLYIFFIFVIYSIPFSFSLGASSGKTPEKQEGSASHTKTVSVYFKNENKVKTVFLEEYIHGVIAAEMPASFPLEALKSQAVASRSYILNKIESGGNKIDSHKGADVCTDPTHCKAWMSKDERFEKWAESDREKNWKKIMTAVSETAGEYMTYDNQPITAVFYAISSGTTERAADVWGNDIPYLQNADSSLDKNAPNYRSTAEFSAKEFRNLICSDSPEAELKSDPSAWYTDEVRSSGGAVLSCKIGGKTFKGTDIRRIFSLRSHNFTLSCNGEKFIFDVVGYGHGVGMSQWGAKFYAEQGKNYRDILRIYYKGITFTDTEV